MSTNDLPNFVSSVYTNTTYTGDTVVGGHNAVTFIPAPGSVIDTAGTDWGDVVRRHEERQPPPFGSYQKLKPKAQAKKEQTVAKSTRRLVRVIIIDPDERIDLDHAVLHNGEELLTDKDDQELFFDLPVKDLLEQHNAYRTTVRDKKVKDREEFLDPIRIRDLTMNVVVIAQL